MNTQKLLVGLVVVVVLVLGVTFPRGNTVVERVVEKLGASSGPEHLQLEVFKAGVSGVQVGFNATTTIACAIQNPTNATSTFRASFRVITSTTTATVLSLATSTNANRWASTTASTAILTKAVGANVPGVSSFIGVNEQNIIGPNEWVLWYYGSGTAPAMLAGTAINQGGSCNAYFYAI